jgi:spermidine/putrescine transport system ATP-binding protein
VTVDSRGNRIHVSDAAGRCVDAVSLEEGADVSVGIRPTGITLGDPDREDVFSVRGEIQNRGYAGDETVYTIDTEYGSFTANTEDRSYDIGDDVTVWWPADEVYLFAPETETASVSDGGGEP